MKKKRKEEMKREKENCKMKEVGSSKTEGCARCTVFPGTPLGSLSRFVGRQGGFKEIMNKEHKIRWTKPGTRKMQEASFTAVDLSQRITDANSARLQPHILKMGLKPAAENIEYRISNIESVGYAPIKVSHSLFLILYFLFLPMWLKPVSLFSISFRRLKPTAIENENFNSFLYSQQQCSSTPPAGGGQGGFVNRKSGLSADKFFNN